MCVILSIQPGATVPQDKLAIACDINKHGYGIAYVEDGNINIIRSVKQPNDPVEVAEHLNGLRHKQRYVHLRHATVGAVTVQNNHPFVVLTNKKKKRKITSLCMMHNGTLWGYDDEKDKGVSDTFLFNERFVRPLAMRTEALLGTREVVQDEFFTRLMLDEIKGRSVVLLFDNFGRSITYNKSQGKDYGGWWASNEYSFNPSHIRSSTYTPPTGGFAGMDRRWERHTDRGTVLHQPLNDNLDDILDGVSLPWKVHRATAQDLGREAWILEMEGGKLLARPPASASGAPTSQSSAFLPQVFTTEMVGLRREIAAAGEFIRKSIERKTRRM